jgi:hypothetical protein
MVSISARALRCRWFSMSRSGNKETAGPFLHSGHRTRAESRRVGARASRQIASDRLISNGHGAAKEKMLRLHGSPLSVDRGQLVLAWRCR